jgi:predicted component of type VI protein secretion system
MSVALEILERFETRLHQRHVSEVNTNSQHDRLTFETTLAFQKISTLIPESIPVILESRVTPERVDEEVTNCREALAILAAA